MRTINRRAVSVAESAKSAVISNSAKWVNGISERKLTVYQRELSLGSAVRFPVFHLPITSATLVRQNALARRQMF